MNKYCLIFNFLSIVIAVLIILWNRKRTAKTMSRIEQMLDDAMNGDFLEETLDESRLSALETRFAHYLSASAVSAKNVALEKDKIKSLIADISHQTKTPIANLLLYSELLQEEKLTESAKTNADAIYCQAEKLRFLIDSLVKLSRLENGIIALSPHAENIQPMLKKIAEQYTPSAENKGLILNLKDTDIMAKYDPKWTLEALGNIVDNAIKYTEKGSINISAIRYELFVRIDISDTGIGISEDEYSRIFSRFYRSETAADYNGVGIGLYLARQIISSQGGYIKVKSSPNHGSTFSVFLPS